MWATAHAGAITCRFGRGTVSIMADKYGSVQRRSTSEGKHPFGLAAIYFSGSQLLDEGEILAGKTRAGLPTATPCAGTSLVTTAPAPISARSPMVTPFKMIARAPINAPRPILIGRAFVTLSVLHP